MYDEVKNMVKVKTIKSIPDKKMSRGKSRVLILLARTSASAKKTAKRYKNDSPMIVKYEIKGGGIRYGVYTTE